MGDTPLEATLVIKLHEQMSEGFRSLDTITTSGQQENRVGFNTTVSVVKPIFFQYKRPHTLASGDFEFGIDERQRKNLDEFARKFNKPSVFYVFPLVTGHEWLTETLSRSVFVDVRAVESNSTHIYIPSAFARNGRIQDEHRDEDLDAYTNGKQVSESVPYSRAWAWEEFKTQLEECSFGEQIETHPIAWEEERRENIERTNRRHGTVERPPAGASVTVFGSNDFLS